VANTAPKDCYLHAISHKTRTRWRAGLSRASAEVERRVPISRKPPRTRRQEQRKRREGRGMPQQTFQLFPLAGPGKPLANHPDPTATTPIFAETASSSRSFLPAAEKTRTEQLNGDIPVKHPPFPSQRKAAPVSSFPFYGSNRRVPPAIPARPATALPSEETAAAAGLVAPLSSLATSNMPSVPAQVSS